MSDTDVFSLAERPAHLGLGARVEVQELFTGTPDWYAAYGAKNASDGAEGRLVSLHTFREPWRSWEMHPSGEELVVCISGQITLIQEIDGEATSVTLGEGDAVINPAGIWHTADVKESATALFITAGLGTEMRPR